MKRALITGLILLVFLTLLGTAGAEIDMQLTTVDGRVTGEVLTYPVPDWVPDYVETHTIDMEVPPDFPPFQQVRVQQYFPKTSKVRAAVEPYLPDPTERKLDLLINDGYLRLLDTRENHLVHFGGFDIYTKHYPENHPKQAEIQNAIQAVRSMLDGIGISYEYPFLTVVRPDELATDIRTNVDPEHRPDWFGVPIKEFMESQAMALDYVLSCMPLHEANLTIIQTRFTFGGLPCWEYEISKNEPGGEGGGYRGGGGMISFQINDEGKLVHALIHYAHEQLKERPFEGDVMNWQQGLAAFTQGMEDSNSIAKGWWLEHGDMMIANPNDYHIIGMEPGCTYISGWTRPVWIIHVQGEFELYRYDIRSYIVDAETGELYN